MPQEQHRTRNTYREHEQTYLIRVPDQFRLHAPISSISIVFSSGTHAITMRVITEESSPTFRSRQRMRSCNERSRRPLMKHEEIRRPERIVTDVRGTEELRGEKDGKK